MRDWPNFDALSNELHTYCESTERIKTIRKDNNEGKIMAHTVRQQEKTTPPSCWNCGSTSHIKANCKAPPSRCENCGKLGHIANHCLQGKVRSSVGNRGNRGDEDDKAKRVLKKEVNDKRTLANKSERKKAIMQRIIAHLAEDLCEMDVDEIEDESTKDCDTGYRSEKEEEEEAYGSNTGFLSVAVPDVATAEVKAMAGNISYPRFIIDSGCKGANICKDVDLLRNVVDNKALKVHGVTGHEMSSSYVGELPFAGKTISTPQAGADLLSLKLLLHEGGTFSGDSSCLTIYDKYGNVKINATDKGDGFWTCSYEDLVNASETKAFQTSHFSAEERERARRAFDLCKLTAHSGDTSLLMALDAGSFSHLDLTAQDLRNARNIFGPCTACLEGKMRAPPRESSNTAPANRVGEHLHADLIPLSGPSIGGNTYLLIAVDEKSSYVSMAPLKNKSSKCIADGFLGIVHFYNSYGHKVDRITTDDENNFNATKDSMAQHGVRLNTTPADMHERRCERYIQTIKARKRSVLATLTFELPTKLEAEVISYVITNMNTTPNSVTGNQSPALIVTHERPRVPTYYFGQTGIFFSRRKDTDMKGEWGIFLGYGSGTHKYLRAYIPNRNAVYSRFKFVPHPHVPPEWNLPSRIRPPEIKSTFLF